MITTNCPKCNSKSECFGNSQTLVGYFSPEGHNHDDNCRSREYICTECKHTYIAHKRNTCPADGCDWKGKKTCFCHKGEKADQWPNEYKSEK